MKSMVVLLLFLVFASGVSVQTAEEFFDQKKTQKKYLLKQIAALKVYSGYLQKGYAITTAATEAISKKKSGENNFHALFFNSLAKVSPQVLSYPTLAHTTFLEQVIINPP
jgi:hypothetical protein